MDAIGVGTISPTSFRSATLPYDAKLDVSGTNLANVTRIDYSWSGESGTGSSSWLKGDVLWNANVSGITTTGMTVTPRVLASSVESVGTTNWTIAFKDGTGSSVSKAFTVTYTPAPTVLKVNGFAPSYSTSSTPYAPTIGLSGSGFNAVTQISWSCTLPNGTSCGAITPWTSANWSGKFTRTSDTVASVTPTFLIAGDPTGTYNWSVTFSGGGATATKTFTVMAAPNAAPTISSVSPNPVTGSSSPQPFTINGANFVSGANITLRDLTAGQTFANRTPTSFGGGQITLSTNFSTAAHSWSVEVINPDGQTSGQFVFTVR